MPFLFLPVMKLSLSILLCFVAGILYAQQLPETIFEQSKGTQTPTYHQGMNWYTQLAEAVPFISIQSFGMTDSGEPLHIVIIDPDHDRIEKSEKLTWLISNAIHAGEPDGVDATMLFVKDLLDRDNLQEELKHIRIVIIPFYNIGGVLNRNSTTRVNQNGPESYGFRGNSKNYDLNRDFLKMDSENARSFVQLFTTIYPELYLEPHVSNGADYPYTLTYLPTQEDKLGGNAGSLLKTQLEPFLYEYMAVNHSAMIPYVNSWGRTPENGWTQFIDHPRYSTGYASLFSTIGIMTEAHMLKPFHDRVMATKTFMVGMYAYALQHHEKIREAVSEDRLQLMQEQSFSVLWEADQEKPEMIEFSGYKGDEIQSEATTGQRLFYDHDKPFEKEIPFYSTYNPVYTVTTPAYYVVPQAWKNVMSRLEANHVNYLQLAADTAIDVTAYTLTDVTYATYPYEGHYPHGNVNTISISKEVNFRRGDYLIPMDQVANRYIVEALEPKARDSFFRWNFFDTYLQRKEGYSSYVFEDLAADLLKTDEDLRNAFEEAMKSRTFKSDPVAQLRFIYENSPFAEKDFMTYPIYRIEAK